ncbi:MAG: Cell division protein FtsH (EC [uncultured Sulfurovum sp.]|uniref:ATP-dependent zinc metalloprotease FtsH n=1 Tax=uncultured Sulfurovum sp. TaxID=269237 RepID=A0A6S6T7F2_9BACT|nr:MAG: Cell division protein FtsH (EC [uncultured Sulfurovum sp.]
MANQNNNNNNNQNNENNGNFFNDNPMLAFGIFILVMIILFKSFMGDSDLTGVMGNPAINKVEQVKYSEIKKLVKNKEVKLVKITSTTVEAISSDGTKKFIAKNIPAYDMEFIPLLEEQGINYEGQVGEGPFARYFNMLLPIIFIIAIWLFLAKKMSKGMGGILGAGKADKMINSERPDVKFDDVQGVQEAKDEVVEIVDFLKYPERYIELGAKIPKGLLLVGPPGTGKTLLAKAVAGEAEVPFFSVSGSSFMEMFVGVGASRVRDLFEQAKKNAPAIIFIDEIDAIGKSRSSGAQMGGHSEQEQTLNQLLAEMDGFGTNTPVIVLAATNRPETLDAALLRAGRFDRQVLVDKPDFAGRLAILKVHSKGVKLDDSVNMEIVAKQTAGMSGADLANIINEAALLAGRGNKKNIKQEELLESIERAFVGLERKNKKLSDTDKKIVAYHESGHALMAELTKGSTRVTKVSIIPRGLGAAGYTLHLPDEEDKLATQKHELIAMVDVLLGGRAAEEIFLDDISIGAGNDLDRATSILKDMVMVYGMTDVAGLMVLSRSQSSFLGGGQVNNEFSEKMSQEIDNYIKITLNERYNYVKDTLKLYSGAIEEMTMVLLDVEVIEGKKVQSIIREFEEENKLESRMAHVVPKETKKEEEA